MEYGSINEHDLADILNFFDIPAHRDDCVRCDRGTSGSLVLQHRRRSKVGTVGAHR